MSADLLLSLATIRSAANAIISTLTIANEQRGDNQTTIAPLTTVQKRVFRCELCNYSTTVKDHLRVHNNAAKHRRAAGILAPKEPKPDLTPLQAPILPHILPTTKRTYNKELQLPTGTMIYRSCGKKIRHEYQALWNKEAQTLTWGNRTYTSVSSWAISVSQHHYGMIMTGINGWAVCYVYSPINNSKIILNELSDTIIAAFNDKD